MRNFIKIVLLVMIIVVRPTYGSDKAIELQLTLAPEFATYSNALFESPAYAALALQNAGIPISLSKPMKILSRQSIQVGSETLDFINKKDGIYFYKVSIGLPLGKSVDVPIEVDVKNLSKGQMKVMAYPPLSGLVPQDIVVKAESKLQTLANMNAQTQLLAYLSEHLKGNVNSEGIARLYESIGFDAYNQSVGHIQSNLTVSGRSRGSAEPLSDQLFLIIAVAIWLVGLPVYLIIVRRGRIKRAAHSREQ